MENSTLNNDKVAGSVDEVNIPVVEERLVVDTFQTVTGEVVIDKRVEMREESVPLSTTTTSYRETRIPHNTIVTEMPQTRTEGDVIIVPVVREESVVVKQLVLVEEIHLTKEVRVAEDTVSVQLARDVVTIERK